MPALLLAVTADPALRAALAAQPRRARRRADLGRRRGAGGRHGRRAPARRGPARPGRLGARAGPAARGRGTRRRCRCCCSATGRQPGAAVAALRARRARRACAGRSTPTSSPRGSRPRCASSALHDALVEANAPARAAGAHRRSHRAWRTARHGAHAARASRRARRAARAPARARPGRRRPLQGDQRLARPSGRRRGARRGRPPARPRGPRRRRARPLGRRRVRRDPLRYRPRGRGPRRRAPARLRRGGADRRSRGHHLRRLGAHWAGDMPDDLLARADRSLYQAKDAGRDTVRP